MQKLSAIALILLFMPWSVTQAALLQVQSYPSNTGTLPKNAIRVPFVTLNLKALEGPITVNSITVQRAGLSSHEDFGRIWAETADYRRTQARRLNNDDQVVLEFRNGLSLVENQNTRVIIFANLEFNGGGRSARLDVIGIDHDGEKPNNSPEVKIESEKIAPKPTKIPYDRSQYRIKCTRGQCRLVPRD